MPIEKKSNHKNAVRSRRLIKQAFAQLLNEKDISKISVTNIVEKANVSRGTFYAHYLDVYDLNNAIQSNIVEAVNDIFNRAGILDILKDPADIIRSALLFLDQNKAYYKLFITSAHGDGIISRITYLAEERLNEAIEQIATCEDDRKILHSHIFCIIGAAKNMLMHWFNDDFQMSADECADYIIRFAVLCTPDLLEKRVDEYRNSADVPD